MEAFDKSPRTMHPPGPVIHPRYQGGPYKAKNADGDAFGEALGKA